MLEVGYTRIVSYKLWYYYSYLVIGLALLGIGTGAVFVAVCRPVRRWATDRLVGVCSTIGALSIAVGYFVIARISIDTRQIWDYGTRASLWNLGILGVICFTLFASFIAFGVIVSALLGRAGEGVAHLLRGPRRRRYRVLPGGATDHVARRAGVIIVAALAFAIVGVANLPRRSILFAFTAVLILLLVGGILRRSSLPDVKVEDTKLGAQGALFSDLGARVPRRRARHRCPPTGQAPRARRHLWVRHPRVQRRRLDPRPVRHRPPRHALPGARHAAAEGADHRLRGRQRDPRIAVLPRARHRRRRVEPVTVGLLKNQFADYTGHLADRPDVHLTQGDGRTYLARSNSSYDLVWYVAPDSYAATNAASAGAFVLSESYLYTRQMIAETLRHLSDDGIMVVQFGELDVVNTPNRTARYIVTAQAALEDLGITDPSNHILVSAI